MVLQELLDAVERVKERAERFCSDMQKSEALTRYVLIDPILRALGWDTADPTQVWPEFPTESGNPDYALLLDGKPHLMVEAKALGKSLDAAKDKGFQYCWKNKVSYYVVTDGNAWEVHDLREMGGKVILRVALSEGSPGEAARALLALWRPAMPSVEPAAPTVVAPKEEPPPSSHGPTLRKNWISLAQLREDVRTGRFVKGSPPPKAVVFPDGSERSIQYWNRLLLAVVDWCQPRLSGKVPITKEKTQKVLVGTSSAGLVAPKAVGPYWVETFLGSRSIVRVITRVLSVVGEDPESIHVVPR